MILLQDLGEHGESAVRRGLDGAPADVHGLGHLGFLEVEAVPQDDRLALPVGQPAQRGEDLTVLLAEQGPRLRGLGPGP